MKSSFLLFHLMTENLPIFLNSKSLLQCITSQCRRRSLFRKIPIISLYFHDSVFLIFALLNKPYLKRFEFHQFIKVEILKIPLLQPVLRILFKLPNGLFRMLPIQFFESYWKINEILIFSIFWTVFKSIKTDFASFVWRKNIIIFL